MLDVDWVKTFGPWGITTGLLVFAIRALLNGSLVPGDFYKAAILERDESRELAANATKVSERLTSGWKP